MYILLDDHVLEHCVGGCKDFGLAVSAGAQAALGPGVGGIPGIRNPQEQGGVLQNFRGNTCNTA